MNVHLEGFSAIALTLVFLFCILILPVTFVTFILSKVQKRRIRQKYLNSSVVKAEYQPPKNLSPAEMGYLFDSNIGSNETIATILDMEQRGIIKIDKTYSNTFNLIETGKNSDNLKPHELLILSCIGILKNIDINARVLLIGFNKSVRESLKNSGYIRPNREFLQYFAGKALQIYLGMGVVLFIYFAFLTRGDLISLFIVTIIAGVFGFPLFLALAFVSAYINNLVAGHSGLWDKKAKQLWPEIEGYREFVRQVDLDELQFESEDLKIRSKNLAFPYAVALGLNTKWQERFKN